MKGGRRRKAIVVQRTRQDAPERTPGTHGCASSLTARNCSSARFCGGTSQLRVPSLNTAIAWPRLP